jgi:uncharacterized protein (DUF1800 family)
MTTREKVAHLLRRFGLGASQAELGFYEKLGVDGTIDRLINYEKVEEGFPVSVWEFSLRNNNGIPVLQPKQVAMWWTLRLLTTQRPMQEKLTLFWHDHFAVSASKVAQGPVIYQYLETLRTHANGNFLDMLKAISKDPAMILWLDNNTNVRGKPNENFAREVMELFTMGIGNYTEADIQEVARAYTGWSFVRSGLRGQRQPTPEEFMEQVRTGRPLVEFQFRPALHDNGPKKILGNEGRFDGDDVAGILCGRIETARYIPAKLWHWFAYPEPEGKVVDRLAKVYRESGYDIKKILYAIAESDEFWSEKSVRKQVKSPADFTIAIGRALGVGQALISQRAPDADVMTPLSRQAIGPLRSFADAMTNQGMELLYPPEVAGWDWGSAWISSATMIERIKLSQTLFSGGRAFELAGSVRTAIAAQTTTEATKNLCELFDARLDATRFNEVEKAIIAGGGVSALAAPRTSLPVVQLASKVLFAAPEFHFC